MDKVSRPKRFYDTASAEGSEGAGYHITLDGRPLRTPQKALLCVPGEALAMAIAQEWQAQGEVLDLQRMTLTRLANVVIDRTPQTRADLAEEFVNYAMTDVVCYLAVAPAPLRARQEAVWRPLRDWIGQTHNIVLVPVDGVLASPQPQASLEAARAYASQRDDFALTGLIWACNLFGSAVLAAALQTGHLDAKSAFEASCLDEDWQRSQWGEDADAAQARSERFRDAQALQTWFRSL